MGVSGLSVDSLGEAIFVCKYISVPARHDFTVATHGSRLACGQTAVTCGTPSVAHFVALILDVNGTNATN